jgi:hypothetical protein
MVKKRKKKGRMLSESNPLRGSCPTCWNRYARAIPIQEGKPCFLCGDTPQEMTRSSLDDFQ